MRQTTFIGSTSSNYLFGKGRGKDKKKRKQRQENALAGAGFGSVVFDGKKPLLKIEKRTPLTNARDFIVGGKDFLKESSIKDLFNAGRDIYNRKRDSSSIATNSTAALGASQAAKLGRSPVTGALIGAKSTAGFLALDEAFRTGKRQLMKTNGIPLKRRIIRIVGAGLGGALLGAAKGSAIGAGIGSGVGIIRGFTQKNKKKDKN